MTNALRSSLHANVPASVPATAPTGPGGFTLCAARLEPAADGGAPDFIHLLPPGNIRTRDGRGPFRLDDAAAVIAASSAELPLPVDENHSIDLAAPNGGPSPAIGWITELQARVDGVWGRVDWTARGKALVSDRAYKGISPHILADAQGRVLAIRRAAVTNNHNLLDLATFHAAQEQHQETDMDLAKLREALGLPADADDAAILEAASARAAASIHAAGHASLIGQIAVAVGLAQDADGAAVLNAVKDARDPAKFVPASAVAALQASLTELTQGVARDKAIAFVDGAIRAGKIANPTGMREHYVARHMSDPAAVEKEIGSMPSLHAARTAAPPAASATSDALDATELQVIALMGVDKDAYLKTRAAQAQHQEAL